MKWDKHGLRLADVPNSGGVTVSQARAGNKRHDSRSGKFTVGGGANKQTVQTPANVDPMAYRRMLDAAREAARSLETIDEGTVADFVKGRASAPDQVDIANFMALVEEQRKTDLIDIIDDALRDANDGEKIRVTAPDALVSEAIRSLGDSAELEQRLVGMGHDEQEVKDFFASRSADDQKKAA